MFARFKRVRIRKHEVGLVFRHGDFVRVLGPGAHWLPGRLIGRDRVEIHGTLIPHFEHPLLDMLVREPALRERLLIVELTDSQRALVWKDGRLGWILGPGRHAFWKEPAKLEVEVFDVAGVRFDHPKIEAVLGHPGGGKYLEGVRVEAHERALLFHEGKLIDQLGPGMYVFWKAAGKITWKAVDLREQVADVAGQEIMTADKVTLRVNLLVTYQVADVVKAVTMVGDYAQALYRTAQLALRVAIGGRDLEKLLADKDAVGGEVRAAIEQRVGEFGMVVKGVGIRDIILPGDMKTILNQVIEAQKRAEANLILRREETAAARSQANTAKLLAENPVLARMKELEALRDILAGAKAHFVFGQSDLTEQVKRLIGQDITEPKGGD